MRGLEQLARHDPDSAASPADVEAWGSSGSGRPPLRICFLAESYHPIVGGMESQARLLAGRLASRGHRVLVITRRVDPQLPSRHLLDGAEVVRVGPSGRGGAKRWPMVATAAARLVRRRRDFDVVVVLGFRALGLVRPLLGALGKVCILKAESNGEMSGEFFATRLSRLGTSTAAAPVRSAVSLRNRTLRRADAFVAISGAVEDELIAAGVERQRIFRIPNAVDEDRFRPPLADEKRRFREALGIAAHERVVIYTGRLVSYKGLPLLLCAFAVARRRMPDIRLLLVGDGGDDIDNCESELRSYVTANDLQHAVTFTGAVDNVQEHLMASDVFAFPTQNEAFGLSLVEAMACGLPVIASPTGGVRDIVTDGVDGVLVPRFEEGAWADALTRVLTDPELAPVLGSAARNTVLAKYAAASVTDAYEAVVDLMQRKTRSRPSWRR